MARTGSISNPDGANVWPHEMRTAQALAAAGHDVEFIRRSDAPRATSADIVMDGVIWEMKAPRSSSMKVVEKNLRKAVSQSPCVIFDCRRMKGVPDKAIERELLTCATRRVRGVRHLLFINRKSEVTRIL